MNASSKNIPRFRPLFAKANIKQQQKKLLASLVLVISNLRKSEKLKLAFLELGAKHVEYGAMSAYYAAVGENFLAVLKEFSGLAWTKEVCQG